jgi:hypothetical protein
MANLKNWNFTLPTLNSTGSNIQPVNGGMIQLPWQVPSGSTSNNPLNNQNKRSPIPQSEEPVKSERMEWTTGGFNYNLNKSPDQPDNQQGNYNALVWSWHVAWLPVYPEIKQSDERVGEQLNLNTTRFTPKELTVKPSNTWSVSPRKTVQSPTVNQPSEPTPNVVTPDEFGGFRETTKPTEEKTEDAYKDNAIQNMQADLMQPTDWKIYGKVTGDQETAIQTLQDSENVYNIANQARIQSLKALLSNDPVNIAQSIAWW